MITTNTLKFSAALSMTLALTVSGCRSRNSADDEVPYQRTQNYKYSELIVKDYDEMQAMVQTLIRKAQKAGAEAPAVEYLQSALKLAFSRPDSDNMVAKLTSDVRRELVSYGSFDRVVAQLAAEAIDNLRNQENTVGIRTTSSFILENLMAEIRPEAEREDGEMRKTMRRIAQSNVELPREVRSERTLRGMYRAPNPGEEAERILKAIEVRETMERKAREKAAKAKAKK